MQLPQTNVVIIKKRLRSFYAPFRTIEYLSLNNVGLAEVNLNGLEQLQ